MLLERPNPSQLVLQIVTHNPDGTPKTDITTASVRVFHITGGVEVVDLASTNLAQVGGTNVWRYIWSPGSLPTGDYFAEYSLADSFGLAYADLEDIVVHDFALQTDLAYIKTIEKGRWKIHDEQMIFYEEDGTTELLRFDLKDINGLPSNVNIFERVPV